MANIMKYKGYIGSIEASLEDGCMHGSIQHINDLVTYEGETVPELEKAFHEQVDDYIVMCRDIGKNPDRPYSGTFNVRIGSDLHKEVAMLAMRTSRSINAVIKGAVTSHLQSLKRQAPQRVDVHLRVTSRLRVVQERDILGDPWPAGAWRLEGPRVPATAEGRP